MRRGRWWWAVGAVGAVGALAMLVATGCAGDGSDDAAPTTTAAPASAPAVTTTSTAAPAGRAAGLPCDPQQLLTVMRDEGGQFALSPAVLAGLRPEGPAQCDAAFARQSFAGPPEAPGPYDALFGVRPDRTGWGLVSVDCLSSEASGRRQVC
ncbi:MAG TPA: hypothetical protein VHF24_10940 [Acidimicrobiales bacterium]|nr:hypothetical protein [Acidimicrobiales bacterium]